MQVKNNGSSWPYPIVWTLTRFLKIFCNAGTTVNKLKVEFGGSDLEPGGTQCKLFKGPSKGELRSYQEPCWQHWLIAAGASFFGTVSRGFSRLQETVMIRIWQHKWVARKELDLISLISPSLTITSFDRVVVMTSASSTASFFCRA